MEVDRRELDRDTSRTSMQTLPGFRDFYPEEAARRNVLVATWRQVARSYAFEEYDGPTLEPLDLYAKKNEGSEEILGQLYRFEDGGGREVALRPEMTPSLARMAAAREKHFRKPMKWFSVGNFFRYERQQRGRLREFLQFNCDILGEASPEADAELIALAVDTLRAFGLKSEDFVVRMSHRGAWREFLAGRGLSGEAAAAVLQVADKLERDSEEALDHKLAGTGLTTGDLKEFVVGATPEELVPVVGALEARGLSSCLEVDLTIVRGLAYYTGVVFEIFDRARTLRAVAGGGRYDGLIGSVGGGKESLPAVGFGMGDVVLGSLLESVPSAAEALAEKIRRSRSADVFVIVADEARRQEALGLVQSLRDSGQKVDFPFGALKVGKQFQAASQAGATHAVVVGSEWPLLKIKTLATREEVEIQHDALADWLKSSQG